MLHLKPLRASHPFTWFKHNHMFGHQHVWYCLMAKRFPFWQGLVQTCMGMWKISLPCYILAKTCSATRFFSSQRFFSENWRLNPIIRSLVIIQPPNYIMTIFLYPNKLKAQLFNLAVRAISNWVLKVIRDCIGFALLRSVIGLENLRHSLDQSDAKLKPIATWSLAFSRAWDRLRVFTLSSHWFVVIFIFVLIGRCDYFGFGFSTLNRKLLYYHPTAMSSHWLY